MGLNMAELGAPRNGAAFALGTCLKGLAGRTGGWRICQIAAMD